jgi:hypothetical protein
MPDFYWGLPEILIRGTTHFVMVVRPRPAGPQCCGRFENLKTKVAKTMLGNRHNKNDARHQDVTEERASNGTKFQIAPETEQVAGGRLSVPEGQTPAMLLPHSITAIPKVISMLEPFVEADAAAEFLHYSPRTIKQMAREGRIPAHPFGSGPRKRWYFLISELAEDLRAQVNSAHGEAGRDKTPRRVI